MPAARLPLELELHILDLATPPRTFYHAREHAQFFASISLVHRDWTAYAQWKLVEHPVFEIRGPQHTLDERLHHLQTVTSNGRATKRLELWMLPERGGGLGLAVDIRTRVPELEELSLRRSASRVDCEEDFAELDSELREIVVLPAFAKCPFLRALPHGLRFLSLAHIGMTYEAAHGISQLAHLDTLLLTDLDLTMSHFFYQRWYSLRILGMKATTTYFSVRAFSALAPSIKHVAMAGLPHDVFAAFLSRDLVVKPTLETLCIRALSSTRRIPLPAFTGSRGKRALELSCLAAGVQLSVKQGMRQHEINSFDLEEWAASVV